MTPNDELRAKCEFRIGEHEHAFGKPCQCELCELSSALLAELDRRVKLIEREGSKTIIRTGRFIFVLNEDGTWIGIDSKPDITAADRIRAAELARQLPSPPTTEVQR